MARKKWFWITAIIFCAIVGTIILILRFQVSKIHEKQVVEILENMGAKMVSMNSVRASETPFANEVSKYNTVYKVLYKKGDTTYTGWFRGVNEVSIGKIEGKNNRGYREEWVEDGARQKETQ